MAQLTINAQLYCGRCGEMAWAEVDQTQVTDTVWLAAKDQRPEYRGPPRPSGTIDCLGCAYTGQLVPYAVVSRMGIDVYHELIWAWQALMEGM
jgi:hypothetical protein